MELWESWDSSVCCWTWREVCLQYVAEVMFAIGGNKLWSHREFVFLVISERSVWSRENVAQRWNKGEVLERDSASQST